MRRSDSQAGGKPVLCGCPRSLRHLSLQDQGTPSGNGYTGTGQKEDEAVGVPGAIRALDPATGDTRWNFPIQEGSSSAGVLGTAGGVVFASSADGYLIALDAANAKPLWRHRTGGGIHSSPISYAVDGKQYIAVASGSTLTAFARFRPPLSPCLSPCREKGVGAKMCDAASGGLGRAYCVRVK